MNNNLVFDNLHKLISSSCLDKARTYHILPQWNELKICGGIFTPQITEDIKHLSEQYLDTLKACLDNIKLQCKKDKDFVEFLFSKKARHLTDMLLSVIKKSDKKVLHNFINKGCISFFDRYNK